MHFFNEIQISTLKKTKNKQIESPFLSLRDLRQFQPCRQQIRTLIKFEDKKKLMKMHQSNFQASIFAGSKYELLRKFEDKKVYENASKQLPGSDICRQQI